MNLFFFVNCGFSAAVFTNADFYSRTSFIECGILYCKFENCRFHKNAVFRESTFAHSIVNEEKTVFDHSIFYEDSIFTSASFCGGMVFSHVTFNGLADFSYSEFGLSGEMKNTNEIENIAFQNCIFYAAEFTDRVFLSKTDFSSSVFKKAPKFYGCKFNQYIIFPPQKNFQDVSGEEAADAYRAIYNAMCDLKSRSYESLFYALIQKSERKGNIQPLSIKFASWIYEITTNYGQSISKPLISLFVCTGVFALIYAYLATATLSFGASIDWGILGNSLDSAVKQVIKPFSFYSELKPSFIASIRKAYPIVFTCAAIFQSVISLSLIALFLLSVRWKFKKD